MFILKGKEQLEKAIAKAKKVKCAVKFRAFGNYSVRGSKGYYTVLCRKDDDGNKIVQCECKGAEKGLVCYHAVSALSLHIGLAKQRQMA
jgi:hypothetical protein